MITDNLIQQVFGLSSDTKLKPNLDDMILLKMACASSEKLIMNQINKLLTSSRTRVEALELLDKCLPYCSATVLLENVDNWIVCCLNRHEEDKYREMYMTCIGNIVKVTKWNPDFNKKFVLDYLAKTINLCLTSKNDQYQKGAALICLSECLDNYASSCNPYRKNIEKYLFDYFDSSSGKLVELAAYANHYLQQVGSGTVERENNVSIFIRKLCKTVQKLYDKIFKNEKEFDKYLEVQEVDSFELAECPLFYDTCSQLQYLNQQLNNCLTFLKILLGQSATKTIYPKEILEVIQRGLSMHICLEQDKITMESAYLSLLLINTEVEILEFLRVFFSALGPHLMPFYNQISKVLLDSMSKKSSCYCRQYNSVYQERIYVVLRDWLQIARTSFDYKLHEKLISYLIKNIEPAAKNVVLTIDPNQNTKSSKANKKAIQDKVISSGTAEASNIKVSERNLKINGCRQALETLKVLFNVTPLTANESLLKKLFSTLLNVAFSIQSGKECFPYDDEECLIRLYEVFPAIYQQDNIRVLPPIHLVVEILIGGSRHECRSLATCCRDGLITLEKFAHPISPSLYVDYGLSKRLEDLTTSDGEFNVSSCSMEFKYDPLENVVKYVRDEGTEEVVEESGPRHVVKIISQTIISPPKNVDKGFGDIGVFECENLLEKKFEIGTVKVEKEKNGYSIANSSDNLSNAQVSIEIEDDEEMPSLQITVDDESAVEDVVIVDDWREPCLGLEKEENSDGASSAKKRKTNEEVSEDEGNQKDDWKQGVDIHRTPSEESDVNFLKSFVDEINDF